MTTTIATHGFTTIEHNGVSFRVSLRDDDTTPDAFGRFRAVVSYDIDLDLSEMGSAEAYPIAAIEAAVSDAVGQRVEFTECTDHGADLRTWEVWVFRPAKLSTTDDSIVVTIASTGTDQGLPADRMAVNPAVFARLCREAGLRDAHDELHITAYGDDAATLDALDDELRDRAQAVAEFSGDECVALFTGEGIGGCDVWARCRVA
jgi:hypothetical protein